MGLFKQIGCLSAVALGFLILQRTDALDYIISKGSQAGDYVATRLDILLDGDIDSDTKATVLKHDVENFNFQAEIDNIEFLLRQLGDSSNYSSYDSGLVDSVSSNANAVLQDAKNMFQQGNLSNFDLTNIMQNLVSTTNELQSAQNEMEYIQYAPGTYDKH